MLVCVSAIDYTQRKKNLLDCKMIVNAIFHSNADITTHDVNLASLYMSILFSQPNEWGAFISFKIRIVYYMIELHITCEQTIHCRFLY